MRSRVPAPGAESICTKPPCCFTRPYTVASPRPVPFPTALVVKNGSNARWRVASSMPAPVSSTARQTNSCADPGPSTSRCASLIQEQLVSSRNTPPSGMASRALLTRLIRICSMACPSAETSGKSSSANTSISMLAGSTRRSTVARSVTSWPRCIGSSDRVDLRAKPSSWFTIRRPLTAAETISRKDASSGPRASSSGIGRAAWAGGFSSLPGGRGGFRREAEQLVPHQTAADGGRDDIAQGRVVRAAREQLGIGEDDGEQVVEVVRDAAGELPDRFHLLRLAELLLEPAALAHVFREHLMAVHSAVFVAHGPSVQTHRHQLAVLLAPLHLRLDRAVRLVHEGDIAAARRGVFEDVALQMAREQIRFALVSQHFDERRIHRQQRPVGCRAEDAERGLLHHGAAGRVDAAQRLFGAPALRDVGRDADDAGDRAVLLAHRRVLRLELEPEQLHDRGHRLAGESV